MWADYDNDGDLDLVASGTQNSGAAVVRVFQNLGRGILTNAELKLPNELGAIAWGDYDNDGDLDLAAAGVGKVYRNDGAGVFAETETSLEAISNGSIAWGDFDNDGWQELLLCGARSFVRFTLLYRNNGEGGFAPVATQIPGVTTGQAAWGDYDNDGYIDILLTGSASQRIAGVYRKNSDGTFSDLGENWLGVSRSAGVWGDFDSDGDLDVLYTGTPDGNDSGAEAIMLRNLVVKPNTKPEPPNGIAVVSDQVLAWSPGSDEQTTNGSGLTYNLRIGTSPGAYDVLTPNSGVDGTRRVAQFGNTATARKWRADLPYGTYYCSVQAVDGAFAGSAFTEETLLVVTNLLPTISSVSNATVFINQVAEIALEVKDYESPAFQLELTASSSSPYLVPNENFYFSGGGTNRTVNIRPAPNAIGIVSVSIKVVDGGGTIAQHLVQAYCDQSSSGHFRDSRSVCSASQSRRANSLHNFGPRLS